MKIVIVCDSQFGNTRKIAEAMAGSLNPAETKLLSIDEASPSDLQSDLLLFGSPTQGGRPKQSTLEFLGKIPDGTLKGVRIAAFDTRFAEKDQNLPLRFVMKIIGYAASKLGRALEKKGGTSVSPPEGFIVRGEKGPLKEGEVERAATWARNVISSIQTS